MSLYPVGIFLVLSAFGISIFHLNQSVTDYYDLVALLLVSFGTLSVFMVGMPWKLKGDMKIAFSRLLFSKSRSYKDAIQTSLHFLKDGTFKSSANQKQKDLYEKVMESGKELIELGFTKEKIETILSSMVVQHLKRQTKISNALKGLAKYPPAFGLMGTVLGLVNVMNGVSQGVDAKSTALKMAIALVATMYGLIVSNAVIFPAAEVVQKACLDDQSVAELAIQTILLKLEGQSLLESQEVLNAMVPDSERLSFIEQNYDVAS